MISNSDCFVVVFSEVLYALGVVSKTLMEEMQQNEKEWPCPTMGCHKCHFCIRGDGSPW